MAETAVRLTIDGLVPLLTEEANLLSGVHREVEEIKHELESIVALLKNEDRRADVEGNNIDNGIGVWVKELREAAFEIEDTTDEYTHFMAQQCHSKLLLKIYLLAKRRHNLGMKIKEIKQAVEGINRRGQTYCLEHTVIPANDAYYDP